MRHFIEQNAVRGSHVHVTAGAPFFHVTFFAASDARIELVLPWFTFPGDLAKSALRILSSWKTVHWIAVQHWPSQMPMSVR
jgi:hypothetical protein